MNFEYRYCIECERIVTILNNAHIVLDGEGNPDWCNGPFTLSTPPDNFDPNWDLTVEEPSPEELAEMNLEAEILLQELEG